MKDIILIGAGGHGRACIDVIESQGHYKILGFIDQKSKINESVLGYSILDHDANIETYINNQREFLISIGQIQSAEPRISLYNKLKVMGARLATIISPNAYVSKHAKIGAGTVVMPGVIINAGVNVGENCIINSQSVIEHDVTIAAHSHISTAAVLNGNCCIGEACFIGSNVTLKEGIKVVQNTTIGAGSNIIHSIETEGTYVNKMETNKLR